MTGFERFDRMVCIHFTGSRERAVAFGRESERVGIQRYEKMWNFRSPYDSVIAKGIALGCAERYLNVTMGHYRVIRTAYDLGVGHLLVMEDDVRFLKDTGCLMAGLESLPKDYDLAMLDSFHPRNAESCRKLESARVNRSWCRGVDRRTSSAAYALSRKGMLNLISRYEQVVDSCRQLLCCDQMFRPEMWRGMNFYVARPNLAVQVETGKSTSGYDFIRKIYTEAGVDFDDYGEY